MRYPPVGKCIYCGSTEGLQDEHIIPFGLQGEDILPSASCKACGDITGAFEGYCLGRMFGLVRTVYGFRTRRKKNRATHLSLDAKFHDGSEGPLTVPVNEFPAHMSMPIIDVAGIIRGAAPQEDNNREVLVFYWDWYEEDKFKAAGEKYGAAHLQTRGENANLVKFSRMIAKIAHAKSVKDHGVDGFKPLLTPFILGKSRAFNHWVGNGIRELPHSGQGLHEMASVFSPTGMLITLVRLFSSVGAPTYHVVTGLLPGGYIPKGPYNPFYR